MNNLSQEKKEWITGFLNKLTAKLKRTSGEIGVKFPYASWGNIVNAVNDVYVLTNFWFVWIPAGFLILLTVLGFNFVGDGLRDAFDPKMKR